jgi:hypothetical protein
VRELEQSLAEAHARGERAVSQAQLTKSGHVYVISNIGSFGTDVFKIGMTRRLEPLDRVKELGDASVPFAFDVHAMIYSEDAPALEAQLHRKFADVRINLINDRKEFFRTDLASIAGFAAAPQVLSTLKERVAKNAAELARDGMPRKAFYLTGRIGDQSISLHAEGEKVVMMKGDGSREEVDLGATGTRQDGEVVVDTLPTPLVPMGQPSDHPATADEGEPAPGTSPLDEVLPRLLDEAEGA